jgi:hypothetical protein
MSITELTGALRDLGQKTHRNQRSKKDLQRLLAKNESCAEMIHALRGFGQRIPRNQRSKKDLQRLLAKRLAQSQATTQNLPFNRLSEGLRKVAAASLRHLSTTAVVWVALHWVPIRLVIKRVVRSIAICSFLTVVTQSHFHSEQVECPLWCVVAADFGDSNADF